MPEGEIGIIQVLQGNAGSIVHNEQLEFLNQIFIG
jgi:hypothetical protein